MERLRAQVDASISGPRVVIFDVPATTLEAVAFHGACRIEADDFTSRVFLNPTWAELAVIANEQLLLTGDRAHVWLEGLSVLRVSVLELDFGS